ncbi:class I tRNA ligase family protein [Chiayiivirga sp.]|uniref:class I tRNA ligase family protein n=1 Tax=Chiayiivirga sp. TaxID=2041042 RepID=UPI003DA985B8
MNCEGFTASGKPEPRTDAERWILQRLQHTLAHIADEFAAYRFDLASQAMYEFAWNEFCDWFLELAKPALQGDDPEAATSTPATRCCTCWKRCCARSTRSFPSSPRKSGMMFPQAEADIEWLKESTSALRRIRSEMNIAPSKLVPLLLAGGDETDRALATRFEAPLKFLARLESVTWLQGDAPAAAAAVLGELRLLIPLAGLIDLDAERTRLGKEIARVESEKAKSEDKLGKFTDKVPAAVVEQERQRLADWTRQVDALREQHTRLGAG